MTQILSDAQRVAARQSEISEAASKIKIPPTPERDIQLLIRNLAIDKFITPEELAINEVRCPTQNRDLHSDVKRRMDTGFASYKRICENLDKRAGDVICAALLQKLQEKDAGLDGIREHYHSKVEQALDLRPGSIVRKVVSRLAGALTGDF